MDQNTALYHLQQALNANDWQLFAQLLQESKAQKSTDCDNDLFAVLEATYHIHFEAYASAETCIQEGLRHNIYNYELYFMLGSLKELQGNYAQALFCYENAALYAADEDKDDLEAHLLAFRNSHNSLPSKAAIVLVTYDNLEYTKICINSILSSTHPSSCELIVIDNASSDGTREWLQSTPYKHTLNEDNRGFPAGCNQGIALSEKTSDIFLLNNDTILMPNALFCLRMAMYNSNQVGMVGSVSNSVSNAQRIVNEYSSVEEYYQYAEKNNIHRPSSWERRLKLVGFAILLRRSYLDEIGSLDEAFGLGHFEDDDLSLRFLQAGYDLLLCRDSFIYHYGNRSFSKHKDADFDQHEAMILRNKSYFMGKWGINLSYYTHIRFDILKLIDPPTKQIRVLEIGCGCGATLLKIKSLYPSAVCDGIELSPIAASFAPADIHVLPLNLEDYNLPFEHASYDYIILGDVLEHLREPAHALLYLKDFLAPNGFILASIPNFLNHSVILPLLEGHFQYEDSGILDYTHIRFFTLESILDLFAETTYQITQVSSVDNHLTEEDKAKLDALATLTKNLHPQQFQVYQYLIKARVL